MATNMTQTQIGREAPFMEDYRRRLLDGLYGGTELYTQAEIDAPDFKGPPGTKVGDKKDPGILDKPMQSFQRGIAGFAPQESAAFNLASSQMGVDPTTGQQTGLAGYQPYLDSAKQGLGTAGTTTALGGQTMQLGIPSLQMAQQAYDPTSSNTQDFMNQYQQNVTQEALKQMDSEAAKAQNNLDSQAQQAGAFGGARFGVQSAELSKNLQDIKSKRVFEDLSRNFQQAQQASIGTTEANRGRQLQSAQTYGSLGQGIGQIGQTQAGQAQAMGNLGAQQAQLGSQGIQSLLGVGQVGRTREQASMDEMFRYSTANAQEPSRRIQFGADILAGTPSVQQRISQNPLPYTNPLAAGVGAGITGASALSNFYGNN
tara:strand:- start:4629 stop:5741 length:1113 start_codon:yes stop_codon:yes gene_type:complete